VAVALWMNENGETVQAKFGVENQKRDPECPKIRRGKWGLGGKKALRPTPQQWARGAGPVQTRLLGYVIGAQRDNKIEVIRWSSVLVSFLNPHKHGHARCPNEGFLSKGQRTKGGGSFREKNSSTPRAETKGVPIQSPLQEGKNNQEEAKKGKSGRTGNARPGTLGT